MPQGPKGGPRNNGDCHSDNEGLQMSWELEAVIEISRSSPLPRPARLANRPIQLSLFGFLV